MGEMALGAWVRCAGSNRGRTERDQGACAARRDQVGSVLREAESVLAEISLLLDLEGPLEGITGEEGPKERWGFMPSK